MKEASIAFLVKFAIILLLPFDFYDTLLRQPLCFFLAALMNQLENVHVVFTVGAAGIDDADMIWAYTEIRIVYKRQRLFRF